MQRTTTPQVTMSGPTGNQTKWELTESINNTFYLDTSLDFTSYPRLQINTNEDAAMIASSTENGSVRFTFTDTKKGLVGDSSLSVGDVTKVTPELLFSGLLNATRSEFKPLNQVIILLIINYRYTVC